MSALHSSATDEWYTPAPILDVARAVLGRIDLDPASDEVGNKRVGAARYYGREDDGLLQPWGGSIWVNPPGGTRADPTGPESNQRRVGSAGLWWRKLMTTREQEGFEHAMFLAFSVELLSSAQGKSWPSPCAWPLCILRGRVRYVRADGAVGSAPTHASALIYVPGTVDRTREFVGACSGLGDVLAPVARKEEEQ